MFGVGRCGGIEKTSLISLTSEERRTRPHMAKQGAGHTEGSRAILTGTNKELKMPGNPRDLIISAERRFPIRIRVAVPPGGFGQRHTEMTTWPAPQVRRRLSAGASGIRTPGPIVARGSVFDPLIPPFARSHT